MGKTQKSVSLPVESQFNSASVRSDVNDRMVKREEREMHQRKIARDRYKEVRRLVPKRLRERDVRIARDTKYAEPQGFASHLVTGLITASVVSIASSISKVGKSANDLSDTVKKAVKFLEGTKKQFLDLVGPLWVVPMLAIAYWLIHKVFSQDIALILASSIFSVIFGKKMWSVIAPKFRVSNVETQSELDLGVADLLATGLMFSYLPKDGGKSVGELIKRVGMFPRMKEGLASFGETCIKFAEKFVNVVFRLLGKEQVAFGDATVKAIKEWTYKVDLMEIELKKEDIPLSILKQAVELVQDGYRLRSVVSDERLRGCIARTISRLETRLRPYESSIMATKTFRVEPECIMLAGGTSVGKTTMVSRIASSILLLSGLTDAATTLPHIWQKGDTKYWESYFGQKCVVMDDAFQEKAVPGGDTNEFMATIRLISNWSCPLNMATLEDKAKFFFTSPLVIMTSNNLSIHGTNAAQVITCPEAVARRIHRSLKVEVAPEYATEKGYLDYGKYKAELDRRGRVLLDAIKNKMTITVDDVFDMFPWDAWSCKQLDWSTGEVSGDVDLRTFAIDTAKTIKRKLAAHDSTVLGLDAWNSLLQDVDIKSSSLVCDDVPEIQPLRQPEPASVALLERSVAPKHRVETQGFLRHVPIVKHMIERGTWDVIDNRYADAEFSAGAMDNPDSADAEEYRNYTSSRLRALGAPPAILNPSIIDEVNTAETELLRLDLIRHVSDMEALRLGCRYWKDALLDFIHKAPCVDGFILLTGVGILLRIVGKFLRAAFRLIEGVVHSVATFFGFKIPDKGVGEVKEESNLKQESAKVRKAQRSLKAAAVRPEFEVTNQAFDGSQTETPVNIVYENTFKLLLEVPGSDVSIGQIVFLAGHLAVMPKHYMLELKEGLDQGAWDKETLVRFVSVKDPGLRPTMTVGKLMSQKFISLKESDLTFTQFPRDFVQVKRDIVDKLFSTEKQNEFLRLKKPVRLYVAKSWRHANEDRHVSTCHVLESPYVRVVPELIVGVHKSRDVLEYQMATEKGFCGAPLMVADPKYYDSKCFLGIHIGGTKDERRFSRYGYAAPLTKELVNHVRDEFGISYRDKAEEDLRSRGIEVSVPDVQTESALRNEGLLAGSFSLLWQVPKSVSMSPNTKLKPSPLYHSEPFGHFDQKPAHLSAVVIDGETRHPMVEGLRNYQSDFEYREMPALPLYVDIASQKFREATSTEHFRDILTFEEAVKGCEGLKLKAINRTTSAGFPYVYTVTRGKKEFFGEDMDYDLSGDLCQELKQRVHYILDEAKRGVRLAHICVDFLKDELRPSAKVDTCQTRVISGSPLDYVIACRMMFGAFMAAMFDNHTRSGMCPGINPYQDWWRLADHLKHDGKTKVFDGDFKRFDASQQPFVLWSILDLINSWYDDGEENARVRTVLWMDLVHSRHLTGLGGQNRFVIQWNKSLPSGHMLTTVVNSWYSLICLVACYCHLTGKVTNVWSDFRPATFGDDNICGVSDIVAEKVNQKTVAKAMFDLFGLVYTSGNKDGLEYTTKDLEGCTFLKRTFLRSWEDSLAGGWTAPLEMGSFMFTAYYYKNNRNLTDELVTKLDGTLGEMSLHKPEVWDEWAPKVMKVMRDLGREPMYTNRQSYRLETASRDEFWH